MIRLCLVMAFAMTSHFMVLTLAPLTALSIGMSTVGIGFLASAMFAVPAFVSIPLGGLIDRVGPRRFIVIGTATATAITLGASTHLTIGVLAAVTVTMGFAQILVLLSGQTMVAAIGPREERLRRFGWFAAAVAGGNLIGPVAAGVTADTLGLAHGFAVAGACSATAFCISLSMPRPELTNDRSPRPANAEGIRALLRDRVVSHAMLASSAVLVAIVISQTFLPVMLVAQGVPATTIGVLLSTVALAALAIRPFVGAVTRAIGSPTHSLTIVALVVMAGLALVGSTTGLWVVAVAVIVLGLGSGVSQPLSMTIVVESVSQDASGRALGVRITMNRIGQLLAPGVTGWLASMLGLSVTFTIIAVALSVVLMVARARVRGRGPPVTN